MMKPTKILSILLVIAFLAPWSAPLAHSFDTTESNTEEHAHYCEISKGPCKHGDACPLKDQHHKNEHKTHKEEHAKQTKAGKDSVEGKMFLSSQCHKGEPATISTSLLNVRFAVASSKLPPKDENIDQSLILKDLTFYNNATLKHLERPPQKPLYQS